MVASKTFYLKTFGCASNFADSCFVKKLLKDAGFQETSQEDAEFVLVNTCTVKGPTVNKIRDFILKIDKPKEKIILLGCLPSDKKFIKDFSKYSMISPYNIDSIVEVLSKIIKQKKPQFVLKPKFLDKTQYSYNATNIAIVQPLIGCLGNCTFCKTKLAKPLFYSYPLENILARIENYLEKGVKEIWISSEDNAAYGVDLDKTYIDLLEEIEKKFAGKAMFRFGMCNPWLLSRKLDQLIDFFKKTKAFYKFLHIPIQSASDNVLKNMQRPYNEKQLEELFSKIRKHFSEKELTIATDTIVGFPGETQSDFEKTLKFSQRYNILTNNVSQFFPLPFTKAATMKQLRTQVKKERSRILSAVAREAAKKILEQYVSSKVNVYIDDIDSNNNYLGRTRNYISVIVKSKRMALNVGEWYELTIRERENFHLLV